MRDNFYKKLRIAQTSDLMNEAIVVIKIYRSWIISYSMMSKFPATSTRLFEAEGIFIVTLFENKEFRILQRGLIVVFFKKKMHYMNAIKK